MLEVEYVIKVNLMATKRTSKKAQTVQREQDKEYEALLAGVIELIEQSRRMTMDLSTNKAKKRRLQNQKRTNRKRKRIKLRTANLEL
jgi:hypothetical protein